MTVLCLICNKENNSFLKNACILYTIKLFFLFRPAPKNEDEMMALIFEYIDRIFSIVRPRKLLYMAIDGVVSKIDFSPTLKSLMANPILLHQEKSWYMTCNCILKLFLLI